MKTASTRRFQMSCLILLAVLLLQVCSTQSERERLHSLMDEAEEYESAQSPFIESTEDTSATSTLWLESLEDLEAEYEYWVGMSDQLADHVSRENLDIRDQITFDSFDRRVRNRVKKFMFQSHLIPINHGGGFYNRLVDLENRGSFETLNDYGNYLERLESVPEYFDDNIGRMRRGIEIGYTLPKAIFVDDYTYYINTHIKENPVDNDLYSPFENFPNDLQEVEKARLSEEAQSVIRSAVMPAYRNFVDFLEEEYIPAARETIATVDLPDGEAYYNSHHAATVG